MKAVVQYEYGTADVLQFVDADIPTPTTGQVLIRVKAAGVDPSVWHIMTGKPLLARLAFGLRKPKDRRVGQDAAGIVEAIGPGVTRFAVGDEVFGSGSGAFAEFALAKEKNLALKPANIDFVQAASVSISACTALQGLDAGGLTAGQRVLIIGASGGVGTYAVQIAKSRGAHVTGVCSSGNAALVTSLGADEMIDYSTTDFADGTRRWDLILDMAGNATLGRLRRALTPRGTVVIGGGEGVGGALMGGFDRSMRAGMLSPFVPQKLVGLFSSLTVDAMEALRGLIESGAVVPVIDRTFELDQTADAVRYQQHGRPTGKVVVTVS